MENRVELLLCVVALAKLGAIAALINTSQRGNVLEHSIRLVSPKRIIVGEELFDACMAVESALPDGDQSVLWVADKATNDTPKNAYDLMAVAGNQSEQNLPHSEHIRANDPLCYFYTSGTTGLPKAAILTNGRYMKAYGGIGEACIQLRSDDRVYVPLPFYHATAMVVAWSSIVSSGATLVLVRKFSASKYWHDVVSQGVTALCYIGELCRYLVAQAPSDIERENKVRVMFGNGLRPEIWREFKQRFDIDRVHEFYGSSEGNVGFMNVLNLDNTVGFSPVPYAIVQYDLDAEEARRFSNGYMRKVSRGEAGLLLGEINEKSPFDGYTEPEKTEKTILRNVFKQGDAWFNTGDMMRDLGFRHAQFVDRLGDTFRWKGENVSTTEVENVLGQ
ncbi:long-chain-acyl-CoA synthetase, partial [Oleiphilus sp. HI0067]